MKNSYAIAANTLVLGWIGYIAALNAYSPDFYYLSVQEDEYLEWGTFWAFTIAAIVHVRLAVAASAARESSESNLGRAWFWLGMAAFCVFVAGEEISWAQRLLGYQPPEYFLRENFQQEPNLHNIIDTSLRKLVLRAIIAGYGIALPLVVFVPVLGRLLDRIGVAAPSPALIPAFAGTLWLYVAYPWSYSGETVELMLGLGFLFAAIDHRAAQTTTLPSDGSNVSTRASAGWMPFAACALVLAAGFATTAAARLVKSNDAAYLRLAETEVAALKRDFLSVARPERERYATSCDLHKRVYTYMEKYNARFLTKGRYAALAEQGMPEERAQYFIDPWNVPYWIRDNCDSDGDKRSIFVYSFGPNHRRDSTRQALGGDDVGYYILHPLQTDTNGGDDAE